MNLKKLSHFQLVAEELNYHLAAKRAHLSQPAISHSIKSLETEFDQPLFDRTSRSVRLTPFGEDVLEIATSLLSEARNFKVGLENLKSGAAGHLSVGMATTVAEKLGGRAIAQFSQLYPSVNFEVSVYSSAQILGRLSEELDHLTICDAQTAAMWGDIQSEIWGQQTGGFFCRPGHPILKYAQPTFQLAHSFGFASLNVTPTIAQSLEKQLGIKGISERLLRVKSDNLSMCRDICLATDYILIAESDNIRVDVETGILVPLNLEFAFNRDLCIATKIGRLLPRAATTMITYLKTHQEQIFADT
ncbi:MAG: LysR family transcriptional regulator [Rhizobiaceae bacterium]